MNTLEQILYPLFLLLCFQSFGQGIKSDFAACENDSLFVSENGVNAYVIKSLLDSELENSDDFMQYLEIFTEPKGAVVGPLFIDDEKIFAKIVDYEYSHDMQVSALWINKKLKKADQRVKEIIDATSPKDAFLAFAEDQKSAKHVTYESDVAWSDSESFKPYDEYLNAPKKDQVIALESPDVFLVVLMLSDGERKKKVVNYIPLVVPNRMSINFPGQPKATFDLMAIDMLGEVPLETMEYSTDTESYIVMKLDLKEELVDTPLEQLGALDAFLYFLLTDLKINDIVLRRISYKTNMGKEFVVLGSAGDDSLLVRSYMINNEMYCILGFTNIKDNAVLLKKFADSFSYKE